MNWSKIKRIFVGFVTTTAMLNVGSVSPAQSTSIEALSPATIETQPNYHDIMKRSAALPKPTPVPYIKLGTKGENATWMNEALSTLHYLPVQFIPDPANTNANSKQPDTNDTSKTKQDFEPLYITLSNQLKAGKLQPLPGKWVWNGTYPSSLVKLWDPNTVTTMTQGAIMHFESEHGLAADGIAGPLVDKALADTLAKNQASKNPYVYVTVSKSGTQHLDVWQNGKKTMSIPANTGIKQSPTPNGTWPIYARMKSQTMKGNLPEGGTYNDPGVPYVNYFYQGCAIHGFVRSSYGSRQSLGCVELPVQSAQKLFSILGYGTLVTVQT